MITLDLLSAAIIALIPLTYLLGVRSIALLVLAAAAASALEALFDPALQSVLPEIVPRGDLQPMVALTDTTDRLARVLGPGSAGLLLLVIPEIHLFSIDAASFLASAAALTFVARRVASAPAMSPSAQPVSKMLDGLREVRRQPSLRVGLAVRASCNLVWPAFTIGLPFELAHRLHAGLASYGLLLGIFGAGNLAGNFLSSSHRAGKHLLTVYCLSWSLVGSGFLALATAPTLALAALATAWMGIFTPLANVSMDTHIATVVPRHQLPRVYALQRITVAAASALGAFAVAAAIDALSAAPVIAAAGGWMILTGTVAAARTRLPKPATPPTSPGRNYQAGIRLDPRRSGAILASTMASEPPGDRQAARHDQSRGGDDPDKRRQGAAGQSRQFRNHDGQGAKADPGRDQWQLRAQDSGSCTDLDQVHCEQVAEQPDSEQAGMPGPGSVQGFKHKDRHCHGLCPRQSADDGQQIVDGPLDERAKCRFGRLAWPD